MSEGNENQNAQVPDSVLRIELISYFHRNPGLEASSAQMAELTGRNAGQVEKQMKKLVQLRILEECLEEGRCTYRYLPPFSISMRGGKARRIEGVPDMKPETDFREQEPSDRDEETRAAGGNS